MRNDAEPGRQALLDDSDSDPEDGGAKIDTELKVNKEYAKKFEHNKKREELHRRKEHSTESR